MLALMWPGLGAVFGAVFGAIFGAVYDTYKLDSPRAKYIKHRYFGSTLVKNQ